MTCTVRCRRSRAPKSTCRCSCGGQNHGGEARGVGPADVERGPADAPVGAGGRSAADGEGPAGVPGDPADGPRTTSAGLREVMTVGRRMRERVAAAGSAHDRAVAVNAERSRRLLAGLGRESDPERLDRLEALFDEATERLSRAQTARARARIGATLAALGEAREMGGVPLRVAEGAAPNVAAAVNARGLLGCFPTDWLRASEAKGEVDAEVGETVLESGYVPAHQNGDGRGLFVLSPRMQGDAPERLVVHEMCHRMEDSVPEIVALEREYHKRRVPAAWLPDGAPRPGTDDPEGPPGRQKHRAERPFFSAYCERRYPAKPPDRPEREGYEIFSMGYEHLMFGPRTFWIHSEYPERFTGKDTSADAEHESFVLGLLATAGRASRAGERGAGGMR